MGEASRRKASKNYPEYKRLKPIFEEQQRGWQRILSNFSPVYKSILIGHGQQIARRDGRA